MANSTGNLSNLILALISALDSDHCPMRIHNLDSSNICKSHDFLLQAYVEVWNLTYLVYINIYYGILRDKHDSLKAIAGKHNDIIEV